MKQIISFFQKSWVIELIGISIFSILIWFVGPLLAIAGNVPFESVTSRLVCIAVLLVVWLIYRLLRWRLSVQRDQQLIADLSDDGNSQHAQSASAAELDGLNRGFNEALSLLKSTKNKNRNSKHFLYELPWYAIIGAPGSGKTTALINSGLNFPLTERLGKHAIKGISGTRDCDWWFADEAILLDTAGRYTTQDSHQEVDATAWHGFLQLLKKYRPRQPLNGVFLAVSVKDLLQQTEEQSMQHAIEVRKRIQELNTQLGVKLPVYVLFTKSDLLAGFTDFFANLTEAERGQVWGETFPVALNNDATSAQIAQFEQGFDELVQGLLQRRVKRLQDERDVQRRTAIFDFPQQMMLLKPVMMRFLEAVFSANRYEEPFQLRGVYFTSGTQEGTPIDRIMASLASSFSIDKQTQALTSGRGKSYFLQKLLKDVVFPEASLVGVDPQVEKRYKLFKYGIYAASLGLVAIGVAIWIVSFASNKAAIADIDKQIEIYRASRLPVTDTRSGLLAALPKLNALATAKTVYEQRGWQSGFGLYQGDKLNSGIDMAYEHLLRDRFSALVMQGLKERMQSNEGNNLDVLYQLLRVYLMFADPTRMDAKVAQPWIKLDWENSFATDPETLANLQKHLDNLLALPLDALPVDNAFVSAVRSKLTQVPLVNQVYSRFKSEGLFDHDHDLNIAPELAPNGSKVFMVANGKELESLVVPGLFTGYGYTELFLKKGMDYVKEANDQNWVLGITSQDNLAENERLYADFKRLYLADYQKTWDGVLTSVKFKPQPTNNQLVETLDLLSRPDSPLKLLLNLVDKNTSLSKLSAELANTLAKAPAAGIAVPAAAQKLLAVAKLNNTGTDPVKNLEAYFEPFSKQVNMGPDKTAQIDSTLVTLKNLHDYLLQVGSAPNAISSEAAKFAGGGINPIQAAKVEFARLPGPFAASLSALTNTGGEQIKTGAKEQLNEMLKTAVTQPCKAALANRYPFSAQSPQDVLMADFAKIFATNGIIDQFFNANLKAFVDTTTPVWKEMESDKALGLSADSIKQFQMAAKIRDAFFSAGGNLPAVVFELKPVDLDSGVGTFRLSIDGQELVYRHGPEQISKFQWPGTSSGSGVRTVFESLDGKQVSRSKEGGWALFRMLSEFNIQRTALPDRFNLTVQIEGNTARFELRAASVSNPFGIADYQTFHCPESL